jgi:hypothetical protein
MGLTEENRLWYDFSATLVAPQTDDGLHKVQVLNACLFRRAREGGRFCLTDE